MSEPKIYRMSGGSPCDALVAAQSVSIDGLPKPDAWEVKRTEPTGSARLDRAMLTRVPDWGDGFEVCELFRKDAVTAIFTRLQVERDEGLAREAELRSEFASLHKCIERQHREALESLQQRLAEAEKLLRRLTAYGRVHFDLNDADVARVEACDFLASPGCADGEKTE